MKPTVDGCAWPLSQLDEAVELLARRIGHPSRPARSGESSGAALTASADDRGALGRAIERLLFAHGLEVEPSVVMHHEAAVLPAPSIVRLPEFRRFRRADVPRRRRANAAGP